ncbi:glycosyltransferase [Microbacterium sp. ASV81]|uniref:Glycosyltransferase n=1 Tax=Microbacterium capsulatum TaxID=3041921 RepID=A0ABU0XJF5_9MICO|nr:glycosyltransferase [Microbacterium sp. ASV81]MDQ4214275.1 glycosyltransferase [Microbacterium sp. ASV81]
MTTTPQTRSAGRRAPVSIVCVYNDEPVLSSCLRRSVEAQVADAPQTELIAVDNRENRFSSAGAALNDGARRARNEVVVFVHQDVVLHSLPALEEAAAELLDAGDIGIMGAVGIDGDKRIIGRIRDRIVRIGEPAPEPRDVDTLDEVLLMVPQEQLLVEPLSEDPLLAWHAYGVEYALRMRRAGRRAVARDIPLTHNSLSTNLAKLDLAHRHVGDAYPELLPIQTTCGTVHRDGLADSLAQGLRRFRSARIWWGESHVAREVHRISPDSTQVFADIRMLIDDVLEISGLRSLHVIDLDPEATAEHADDLSRFDRPFSVSTADTDRARAAIAAREPDELIFVAGLEDDSQAALSPFGAHPHVLGSSASTGRWALIGVSADALAPLWPSRRNRPLPWFA